MAVAVTGSVKHPHIIIAEGEGRSLFAERCDAVVNVVQKSLIQGAAAVGFRAVCFKDLISFNAALGGKVPVSAVSQSGLKKDTQTDLFFTGKQSFQFAECLFLDLHLIIDIIPLRVERKAHGVIGDAGLFETFSDQLGKILLLPRKMGNDGNKKGFGQIDRIIHFQRSFILQEWVR